MRTPPPVAASSAPDVVNAGNIAAVLRQLDERAPDTRGYGTLRGHAATYLSRRSLDAAQTGDMPAAMSSLRAALVYFTPEEIQRGSLPAALAAPARALMAWSAPRGDEARSLAAARVLMAVEGADATARATWDRIAQWGIRNRTDFERPWVREGELAEIYREAALIVPARDVIDEAATRIIARRRAAQEARATVGREGPRLNADDVRQMRAGLTHTAAELAVLYLRVGEIRAAANRLTELGASESPGLASALGSLAQGEGGADALMDLAERLEAAGDPAASAGVCRVGRRAHDDDARFPRCLASAALREGNVGLAAAHLNAASELRPAEQRLLRAAIEASTQWLAREVGADDPAGGRAAYETVTALSERWRARYASATPPVATADIEEAAAQLELSTGTLDAARAHLERATHAEPASRDAYLTLAEIAWRHRDGAAALRILDEGLRLPLRPTESDSVFRPAFAVRRAQATEVTGDAAAARQRYTEAAEALDALARSASGVDLANALHQRAVVSDALGDAARVRPSLDASLDAAPESRDLAARAMTFALSRGRWADARDFYRRARAHVSLDRPWQVYFALWGSLAARLGRQPDDGGVRAQLESIAGTAGENAAWTARLAQRYVGAIDREALLRFARTPGQRTEAHFYEGMMRLADGDEPGALGELRATVGLDVLRYFEYEMAWEMLARRDRSAR